MSKGVRLPPYSRHARGSAKVRIAGKDFYLGRYDTPESRQRYERLLAEWVAQGTPKPWSGPGRVESAANGGGLVVVELIQRYLKFAEGHYVKDGKRTSEVNAVKRALAFVETLYGRTPVVEFGPLALKACREAMVGSDVSRKTVNSYVGRVRRMFRWGTENEVVPVMVPQALACVAGLLRGRTEAKETDPVLPVESSRVRAILPRVSRQIRAMIELQLLTGMRPGEVIQMRTRDLKIRKGVWEYRPASHKTAHHGKSRVVFIGPRAQAIVKPFMQKDLERPLFSPEDAERERLVEQHATAKHPRRAKQLVPDAERVERHNDAYSVATYRRGIQRACVEVGVTPWHPNQLRHNAATLIRSRHGLEATRTILGHSSVETSEIYAERDEKKAADVMRRIG